MTLEWKDPPARNRGGRQRDEQWTAVANELRAHPGQWALIAHNVWPSFVTAIRNGTIGAFQPAGHYDATSRGNTPDSNRVADVYARYIGNGTDAPAVTFDPDFSMP